ncbi:nucleotidyltransferase domain-containing protein [Alkaliphilus pronyensis]|uniref:Nucleotidyltransferase domain-containing protein n=1 Tax=Alkaliphilus pronyensis TaxID=1482732 RepID=A0A6I0F858_9FIRM|nr:nucleotidyltransferase domain-containing protein [Alkaliphilus pronyensis]KAB3534743.1 nucleotidyltransferase domain-containing protein [Alkaliphilus pronyensis]
MYGLLDRDLKLILEAVSKYKEIDEVILFGSRAMRNYKKGSDVDLAIVGENIDRKILRKISDDLNEEYPLPYFFDVVDYKDISNKDLKTHIDSVGKSIYKRNSI